MADTASLVARVTAEGAATAAKQLDNFAASATKAEAATDKMTPAVKEAAKTTPKFGSAVTNVSYQLQDFIVQVSSGQSALLAFSQQAPQLLSGFGALGAVLGIAAAATSVLYNAFGSTNEATKNLESSTKALNAVIQTSKTGVTELSDSYIQLATGVETATASQAQLEAGIAGAENTIAAMNAKLKETADISYLMSGSITGANDSLQKGQTNTSSYTGFLSSLADQFGVTKQQAEELIPLLASVAEKPTQDNVLALTTRMGELSSATDSKVTPAFRNFRAELLNAIATQDTAKKSLDILKAAQLGQAEATNSSTEATKQNITKMIEYAQAQLQGAKAVLAFNAAQDKQQFAQSGATAEQIAQYNELINKQYEKDVANYDAAQQKKAEAEAKSAAARAKSEADRQAAQEKQADAFLTLVKKQNSSEVEQVTIAAAEKQKQLDEYYAKGLVSQQEYETASADIANAAQEKKDAIVAKEQEQQAKRQEQADAYLAQLQANFEGESAELDRQYQVKQDKLDKFHEEGLISEEDYQNAIADLRRQKADALIAADLSTWGTIAANVKSAASENTALYKAAAITEATISTYLAATKALATGGPILGPILAASTIALGLANVAKISSAREQGGQLSAGQASTIAERGKPEVIMPAGASRVRTAQQMKEIMGQNGGSTGPANISIINNTSAQIGNTSVEQDEEGRLRIIIEEQVAASLQNSNSKISKARKATRNAPGFK